ncbi:MAG: hypothetical protein PHG64_14975, partial [Paludibacter sp.]|nr:hypothetical protein [Paludibacter sp.]
MSSNSHGEELTENIELLGGENIKEDLEIVRPFSFETAKNASLSCALPGKYGYFPTHDLTAGTCVAEYRLGNWIAKRQEDSTKISGALSYEASLTNTNNELALPMVALQQAGAWQATVCTDPYFSTHYAITNQGNTVTGECRYRYWSSKVPLEKSEARTFAIWIGDETKEEPRLKPTVDAFFRLAIPEV